MTRRVYQLIAHGVAGWLDAHMKISSKKVFTSREAAEAHREEFISLCLERRGDTDIHYMERVDEVGVVELELVEDGS